METILLWLAKAAELQGAWGFISNPASWLLHRLLRRRGGVVRIVGFDFFPNRPSLIAAHGSLADRLRGTSTVCGIWVIGQKFFHAGENLHVVKRLLLPHPDGDSFQFHSKVSNHADTIEYVRGITKLALKSGTKVRWYEHFIYQSILLVDTDKPEGWVHLETVLPYSKPDHRPSITVHRKFSEQTVLETQRIFNEMWDSAKDAPSS